MASIMIINTKMEFVSPEIGITGQIGTKNSHSRSSVFCNPWYYETYYKGEFRSSAFLVNENPE